MQTLQNYVHGPSARQSGYLSLKSILISILISILKSQTPSKSPLPGENGCGESVEFGAGGES